MLCRPRGPRLLRHLQFTILLTLAVGSCALKVRADATIDLSNIGTIVCRTDFLELANVKPLIVAVPGKKGENGLLEKALVDSKGNQVQIWCLKARVGQDNTTAHPGPDFGFLYKPAGAKDEDAVWIGACCFANGRNDMSPPPKGNKAVKLDKAVKIPDLDITDIDYDSTKDVVKSAKIDNTPASVSIALDQFTTLGWHNYQAPNDTKDWDYTYDVAANKLLIEATAGTWKQQRFQTTYTTDKRKKQSQDAPPKVFAGLYPVNNCLKGDAGTEFSPAGGENSSASFPFNFALLSSTGGLLQYSLFTNRALGLGTDQFPYEGEQFNILPGDNLTIQADAAYAPTVTGPAALPEYGAWVVDNYDDVSVTYRATTSASLAPGTQIDGFQLYSNSPLGRVPWIMISADPLSGGDSYAWGAVSPSTQP